MNHFEVGALDLCKVFNRTPHAQVIWETIDLVSRLENMGYARYWLTEHHTTGVAHSAPEILIPALACSTARMHIGVAGVLLRYQSPIRVAKIFRLLHVMFPGRIDLGLARGTVPDPLASLLLGGANEGSFEEKVTEVIRFVKGNGEVTINPLVSTSPEIWLLGSKIISAELAGKNGVRFCFARFLVPDGDEVAAEAIQVYRNSFVGNAELTMPEWGVAVAGICAKTDLQARQLMGVTTIELGRTVVGNIVPTVAAGQEQCEAIFMQMVEKYSTSRFVFHDMCTTAEYRIQSYRFLAEALNLGADDGVQASKIQ